MIRFVSALHNLDVVSAFGMVSEILSNEGISCRRLARCLGMHDTTIGRWRSGIRKPSPMAKIVLRLIERHGLNAVLSGDLTQSVDTQGKDAMQGSDKKGADLQ